MKNDQPNSLIDIPEDSFFHMTSFLDEKALFSLMRTSKDCRIFAQKMVYQRYYEQLIKDWNDLLETPLSVTDFEKLKDLSVKLYQRGLISKIIADLKKVNLRAVIIQALLQGYEFKPENHIYLELASHLLFFNKNSAILYAQDGENHDKFPMVDELEDVLTRYAKKTNRDSFYLIYTKSSQVIYFNKLTKRANIFVCPHVGWGIYGRPDDHIFSVLLYRRISHVDCLVDVPDITFLRAGERLEDAAVLERTIRDGSLFIAFYKTYIQYQVDRDDEYEDFVQQTRYLGHYTKTNPGALNGNSRNEKLEEFIDYLQERLFPVRDNSIYNAHLENRTPILSVNTMAIDKLFSAEGYKSLSRTNYFCALGKGLSFFPHDKDTGYEILDRIHFQISDDKGIDPHLNSEGLQVSKYIAHRHYSRRYIPINTKDQLATFLVTQFINLDDRDRGQTIFERLDYGYLRQILLNVGICSTEQFLAWMQENIETARPIEAYEPYVKAIFEKGLQQTVIPVVEEPKIPLSREWTCIIL